MATASELHMQFVEAWNKRDFTTFRALLHPNYTYSSDGKVQMGPEAGVQAAKALLVAFPDAETRIASIHTFGELSFGEFVTTGTHTGMLGKIPASRKSVVAFRCNIIEVADNLILRERDYMNIYSVMVQIGAAEALGA